MERTDKKTDTRATQSNCRTVIAKRRRIIVGACVGSGVFLIIFRLGLSLLVA